MTQYQLSTLITDSIYLTNSMVVSNSMYINAPSRKGAIEDTPTKHMYVIMHKAKTLLF